MRIDVILEANNAPETVLKLGRLAEQQGLGGVWVSNMNDARDPFINFVPLAMGTERIRLGPIAVSPFELHPLKMASSLLTLNEVARGRAQIVVGAGGGTAAAIGKPVQYRGEIYEVKWYNPAWVKSAAPAIYVGAGGPQMLRSAARYADGIMVSDFVVEHVRKARTIIDASLAEVGRDPKTFPMNVSCR